MSCFLVFLLFLNVPVGVILLYQCRGLILIKRFLINCVPHFCYWNGQDSH
uniref:Uncharacterized protein n=1 Tax=Anguilla anguilla TaxID=7936 RepID=A0A0E9PH31_ANGAN